MALIVSMGEEEFEMYESRLFEKTERPVDVDRERRKEVRMLEKERDWKREVRILTNCYMRMEQLRRDR